MFLFFFFFKQKTAYEMRISDWSSDVCSSDLDDRFDQLRLISHRAHLLDELSRWHGQHRPQETRVIVMLQEGRPGIVLAGETDHGLLLVVQIGRASCRERVCQYV